MAQTFLKFSSAKVLFGLTAILFNPWSLSAETLRPKLTFSVENYGDNNLVHLFVYPQGSDDRINEKLQGRVVKPGETADIDIYNKPGECLFDIKAVFANGEENIERQANICDMNGGTYSLYGKDDRVFKVSNRTDNNIVEFYWRKPGDNWGRDLLGSVNIGAKQTVVIPVNDARCLYEFRAVFANGRIVEQAKNVCINNNSVVSDVIFDR
ncbi:MAG TPA: hypothetical protein V6D28_23860 [Leptolyngbyaceae cyanobacterium]